ncbi:MAG TPA: GAF domain-containing protein, partial [Anaerolineae bacterium]
MAKKPMKWYTQLLGVEELPDTGDIPLSYRPVPDDTISAGSGSERPVWRVRFDPLSAPEKRFGLDINGEVILGRGNDAPDLVDLTPCNADKLGVSRRHLALRPTPTNLFVVDLGSTNGTWRNGHSIGVNTPYSLVDGDTLAIGGLQLIVHIVHRPSISTAPLVRTPDLADALLQIAKAITSQLDIDEVLNQVAATAMSLTSAGETGIWLVDEESGELFLEAERGINDEKIHRTRLPIEKDTPAARVVKTGQPLRATRQPGKDMLKMMTNYLVESMVHVPITLGGITFGVLAAAHRQPAKEFDERDEELLAAIADFAAIAIQNARLYQATDKALEHRVKELAALNEVSRSVTASLDLDRVYEVLVEQVNKHWPVEVVRLYLLDERQGNLYTLGQDPDNTTTILLSDKGIMVKAARSGHTVVANDAQNHPDYNAEVDCLDGEEPQSVAYIPLVIKERVVGVLALYNKVGGIFSAEDISRLETFANPVATAIENARLFEESERQRAAIQATAETLSQPLLLLDEYGNVLVSNQAASQLLDSYMAQVFEAVSRGVGRTIEAQIGNQTFLSTTQHLPDVGTIVVMQDITYVKQLEQDRSEFVHMLSHDLKNPLMAINGWTSLIEKTVPLDERGERYVTEIESAAGRMLEMVNELLQTVTRDDAVQLVREP